MQLPNGTASPLPKSFDSIPSAIEAFRAGEFIVVLDSTDRENEGDLIIAAEHVTPEKMAFLVRFTSGLICAPLTNARADALNLPLMVSADRSEDPKGTAYTISIDARDPSVSTGISAHDRALACRLLADRKAHAGSFRRPGHVFPLRARDGGVRERPGHTEATVEFCRLAGTSEVGVIAELVRDGDVEPGVARFLRPGMMRRDHCLEFGREWGLKVVTIEDLVDFVSAEEKTGSAPLANGHSNGVNGVH